MFFCIRRLVSPIILLYDYIRYGKVAENGIQLSVACFVVGTLFAGWDTLNSDVLGYSIAFLNNLITTASTVAQKGFSDKSKLGALGTLYYTALTSFPLSILLAITFGELSSLLAFPHFQDPGFWVGFAVSLFLGPLLTYSSILCTTYNSPLALSITGNLKDVATTVLGAALFPGFIPGFKNVGGILLTFVGGGLYSYLNLRKARKKEEKSH